MKYESAAVEKHLAVASMRGHLRELASRFAAVQRFDPETLELTLRNTAEARGVKPAALIHAARVSVTGRAVSPGLFEVLELLGSTRVIDRLDRAASMSAE